MPICDIISETRLAEGECIAKMDEQTKLIGLFKLMNKMRGLALKKEVDSNDISQVV